MKEIGEPMKGTIRIELLSQLLPGSGSGNGASIDADCTFDAYGFPIIYARRLKGCLRETAEKLLAMKYEGLKAADIRLLFGDADQEGLLRLGNAQIENVRDIEHMIDAHAANKRKDQRLLIAPGAVQDYYTCLHTRTALTEEGIPEDQSLRTIRVLRSGLVFTCDVDFPKEYEDALRKCLKALRHIGTNRSRGLGEVRMTLEPDQKTSDGQYDKPGEKPNAAASGKNQDTVEHPNAVEMSLRLETPLVLEGGSIPGAMLRGALAACYIRKHDAPASGDYADDPLFARLFQGSLRFEPAFPTDAENRRYHLASSSVVKYKMAIPKVPKYVDLAVEKPLPYQTKRIGECYLCAQDAKPGHLLLLQAVRERHMHHSQEGELFEYEAIARGSRFLTRISGEENDVRALADFVKDVDLLFIGRSKGAEYGRAVLERCELLRVEEKTLRGRRFIVTLQTPVILTDEDTGAPMADSQALTQAFCRATGEELTLERSFISAAYVGGYHAQWRLNKPPALALEQGTTLVLRADRDVELPCALWLGERFTEGYGLLRVESAEQAVAQFDEEKPVVKSGDSVSTEACKAFLRGFERRYVLDRLKKHAFVQAKSIKLNNTTTVQRLYALIMESKELQALTQELMDIRDPNKRMDCLTLLTGEKVRDLSNSEQNNLNDLTGRAKRCFRGILEDVLKEENVFPSVGLRADGLAEDWALHRGYLLELMDNAVTLGRREANRG